MRIAFDLDNTLVDGLGKSSRPGMRNLLIKLRKDRHQNVNPPKDLRLVTADAPIDDDPKHIAFTRSLGRRGILVRSYRGGSADARELAMIERMLRVTLFDRVKALIPKRRS